MFVLYILAGLVGGVLGGMGMGGGTLLIPLLTIFLNLGQHSSQAINLITFIPMAIVALIIHLKNHLINFKGILFIIIPGIISCFVFCFISKKIDGELLRRCFGGFLIILSVVQIIIGFCNKKK